MGIIWIWSEEQNWGNFILAYNSEQTESNQATRRMWIFLSVCCGCNTWPTSRQSLYQ